MAHMTAAAHRLAGPGAPALSPARSGPARRGQLPGRRCPGGARVTLQGRGAAPLPLSPPGLGEPTHSRRSLFPQRLRVEPSLRSLCGGERRGRAVPPAVPPRPLPTGAAAGGRGGPSSPAPRPRPLTFSSPCQLSSRRLLPAPAPPLGPGRAQHLPAGRGARRAGSGVRFGRVAPEAGVQSQDTAEDCTARPGEAVVAAAAAAGQERRGDEAVQLGAARRKFSL